MKGGKLNVFSKVHRKIVPKKGKRYSVGEVGEIMNDYMKFLENKVKTTEEELYSRGLDPKEWYEMLRIVEKDSKNHAYEVLKGNENGGLRSIIQDRLEETFNGKIKFIDTESYTAAMLGSYYTIASRQAGGLCCGKGSSVEVHEKAHMLDKNVWQLPSETVEAHAEYQSINFWDDNRLNELSNVELLRLYSSLTRRLESYKSWESAFSLYVATRNKSAFSLIGKNWEGARDYLMAPAVLLKLSENMDYSKALSQVHETVKSVEGDLLWHKKALKAVDGALALTSILTVCNFSSLPFPLMLLPATYIGYKIVQLGAIRPRFEGYRKYKGIRVTDLE